MPGTARRARRACSRPRPRQPPSSSGSRRSFPCRARARSPPPVDRDCRGPRIPSVLPRTEWPSRTCQRPSRIARSSCEVWRASDSIRPSVSSAVRWPTSRVPQTWMPSSVAAPTFDRRIPHAGRDQQTQIGETLQDGSRKCRPLAHGEDRLERSETAHELVGVRDRASKLEPRPGPPGGPSLPFALRRDDSRRAGRASCRPPLPDAVARAMASRRITPRRPSATPAQGRPRVMEMAGGPVPRRHLPQGRRLGAAARMRVGTAGVEMAAGGWVDGARHVALEDYALASSRSRLRDRHGRQQRFR